MKLYNSETRRVEQFVPNNPNEVTLYTCGPTVYHFAHIGNLRCYIMEDILEKSLNFLGYNVKRAMNITDVGHLQSDADTGEDKMLLGAKRENKSVMDIAKSYTQAFKNDMHALRLKWPECVVPATSVIEDYIKIISTLLDKGFAYVSNGNVYFNTAKLAQYYRLSNQGSEDLAVGVRESVSEDLNKKNKNDFVLWFTKSKFENQALKWDSPWGVGYPGWHIECSAISLKTLGENLDIHCGGIDNKFPHHTNEIAQTESYIGHKWCKHWFHVEHLITKQGKMSKSSGEFLTLSLLKEKGYLPEVYKFFCLQSHYRKQLVFSYENLNSAKSAYEALIKRIEKLNVSAGEEVDATQFNEYKENFKQALANDLNTSLAITCLFDVLKSNANNATKVSLLKEFDTVLGLGITDVLTAEKLANPNQDIPQNIMEKVQERATAKANKNYALADEIRKELEALGFVVTDTKDGPIVKKI